MRVVILTTNSVRRRYLVREIQKAMPVERVFVATRQPKPPFETGHPFEDMRNTHEAEAWFTGRPPHFSDIADMEVFQSLNQPDAVTAIAANRPDAAIVFGTGKLSREVIDICPHGCLNLHGGDPERYRGLDAPLWTVYHGDFEALVTTLHRVAPTLDSGDIVAGRPLAITSGMGLHELRRAGTEAGAALAVDALTAWRDEGRFESRPQTQKGRYYSHMPSELKEVCVRRFERHTRRDSAA